METEYPVDAAPATPEYVLAVLNSHHRFGCQVNFGDEPAQALTFEMTVSAWRFEAELLPWVQLAESFNEYWGINCTQQEWRAVLKPERKRTLREVCELIAANTTRPIVRPSTILGGNCLPAGVFLTLRSRLKREGIDVTELRPSTPLKDYARRHSFELLDAASRLQPGVIDKVSWFAPINDAGFGIFMLSMACLLLQWFTGNPWLTIIAVAGVVVSYLWNWIAVRCIGPQRVEFDSLVTFGDLSRRIALRLEASSAA